MADLTPEMRAEMLRAAEAATPGPWKQGDGVFSRNAVLASGCVDTCSGEVWSTIFHADLVEAQDGEGRTWYTRGTSEDNAAHIVASCPASVLALLDERDRLERERDDARSDEALRAMEQLQAESALDVACERMREMAEALEPFADEGRQWDGTTSDEFVPTIDDTDANFTLGDLRRAARVLSAYKASADE